MNAAENPFATGRLERLLTFDPALIGTSWAAIEKRWSELGHRACVTGRHGSGKTTFLDAMAKRLFQNGGVGHLFFNDQKRDFSVADHELLEDCDEAFLLIDGDEYLPWMKRRELLRATTRSRGCLFARHRRRGLPELLRLQSDPELAQALLERISPEWRQRLEPGLTQQLDGVNGNLRELWLECFDLAGNQENALDFRRTFW